jgi:hypothetical protein
MARSIRSSTPRRARPETMDEVSRRCVNTPGPADRKGIDMHTLNAQATVSIDGGEPYECEVTIEQETIMARSEYATKPDPGWEFSDDRGHFHAFTEGGELPTLRTEQIPCDGACGDPEHTVPRYLCLLCGQEIEPCWRPDVAARMTGTPIPGRKSAEVVAHADRPLGQHGDKVSIRVLTDGPELIGIGSIAGFNGVLTGGDREFATTIAMRFLEPRLSA